jgi:hypothetical protein
MLLPCPGCGVLFPPFEGPTHRYIGASAACWALLNWTVIGGGSDTTGLLEQSRVPENLVRIPVHRASQAHDEIFGDAYGVQHHGKDSPQAIQSGAIHLLNMHGIISGKTTRPRWPIERALRKRGIFCKLDPPVLGSALTIRHLFPGGGVVTPITRSQYVVSVYEVWMERHGSTVEEWYGRYVVPD